MKGVKEMEKTYWVVTYNNIGQWNPMTAWFDDRETMREFISKQDCADKPIRVRKKGELAIMFADALVEETEFLLSFM